jgi:hypothetical protein
MKNIYILLVITCILAVGCNDDYLDTAPQDQLAKENFFNSESDLQLYINGIHYVSSDGIYDGDQGTDNTATTGAVEIKNMMLGDPSAENISSGWSWGYLRSINFFLENYSKADIDETSKKHFEGVAKYYRAEDYFSKVRRFSDVPWYSKTLSVEDEDLYKPRDSRALVVDSIIKDIQFASNNIREDVAFGNIHKWAALMLEARIALHEGTFRKYHPELGLESTADRFFQIAEDATLELMNSGKFDIFNTGDATTDYFSMFQSESLAGNSEAILVNVYDAEKDKNSGSGSVFGDYEKSPSKALIDSYLMADGSRYTDKASYGTETFVQEFESRDPRLYQTFAYPGFTTYNGVTPYIQLLNKNFTGYHQIKGYYFSNDDEGFDMPAFRYAETLLIYAEAKAELGTLTQADVDISINKLRARVDLPDLNLSAANLNADPVMETRFPNVSGTNKGVIFEIRRERRVELAMESMRLDDINRWSAGKVLEIIPVGMYFPGLGNYDMTGDGVEDISIIASGSSIPSPKETNSLGVELIYYKAGLFGDSSANLYLSNGTSGNMVTDDKVRNFIEPKYYYRPVPAHQVALNPALTQIMGW